MKKLILSAVIIFVIFVLIGIFSSSNKKVVNLEKKEKAEDIYYQSTTSTKFNQEPILSSMGDFQRKVEEETLKLTENLLPDDNKKIDEYRKELNSLQEKVKLPQNQEEISPEIFFNLAKELSLIRPPTIFYSFHKELIKTYYSIGLAIKEAESTNDPMTKILLYNFIKTKLEQIKP